MPAGAAAPLRVGFASSERITAEDCRLLAALLLRTGLSIQIVPASSAELTIFWGSDPPESLPGLCAVIPRTRFERGSKATAEFLAEYFARRSMGYRGWGSRERVPGAPRRCDSVDPVDLLAVLRMVLEGWTEDASPRDEHARPSIDGNQLVEQGCLESPYADIMARVLGRVWSQLLGRELPPAPKWSFCLSFDIDSPGMFAGSNVWHYFRLIPAGNLRAKLRFAGTGIATKLGLATDPHLRFDELLDMLSGKRVAATFFSQTHRAVPLDNYQLGKRPAIVAALREALRRGHEVGLHSSYGTRDKGAEFFAAQWSRLQDAVGGKATAVHRAHYLRTPDDVSLYRQNPAGAPLVDSSLLFGRVTGFRRGTAYPFRIGEGVIEQPPSLMDATLRYQHLMTANQALATGLKQVEHVARTGGVLTVVWHPHNLEPILWEGWSEALADLLEEVPKAGGRFQTLAAAALELQALADQYEKGLIETTR